MRRVNYSNQSSFPYRIFVNVILLDGKIINWKINGRRWSKDNLIYTDQPEIVKQNFKDIEIKTRSFKVWSEAQLNKIENGKARNEN